METEIKPSLLLFFNLIFIYVTDQGTEIKTCHMLAGTPRCPQQLVLGHKQSQELGVQSRSLEWIAEVGCLSHRCWLLGDTVAGSQGSEVDLQWDVGILTPSPSLIFSVR